ncbi:MAG: ArsR family transcriptional regulator [Gemmatimonadales bacterium]|nr:MAG: ArsR family transcriptional regulator [Gemmatimonadales bacterium]
MTDPKSELFDQFARIGKVLASRSRLLLLDLLTQGEKPVETLAEQAGLSVPNASNHLRELRTASLVRTRRDGQQIYYRLANPSVRKLLRSLQDVAYENLAEVRELVSDFYEDPDGLEAIDLETLNRRVQKGDVIVLDVRPDDEYAAGHIAGAVSIPIGELEQRLQELPPGREVVAYCRGPYCLYSRQAVERLRSHGLRAYRMEEGVAEWAQRGLPVSAGEPSLN